jgi:hypothetical protein
MQPEKLISWVSYQCKGRGRREGGKGREGKIREGRRGREKRRKGK